MSEEGPGEIQLPGGCRAITGQAFAGLDIAIVASRYNARVVERLLAGAVEELESRGITRDALTIVLVPGAWELPYVCRRLAEVGGHHAVVALGCVVRGETPHFDYVAAECASGLQLAGIETGVPVAFGVLTVDNVEQAEARIDKAAEAVRSALEMADLFARLRASARA